MRPAADPTKLRTSRAQGPARRVSVPPLQYVAPDIETGQEEVAPEREGGIERGSTVAQYTRGTILHGTRAVYRSHSFPYFARQTLSSSAWRVNKSAT